MILATIYQIYDDGIDPNIDVRVDLYVPWGNGTQYWTVGILVQRSTVPDPYTWDDIATACTAIIDTCGVTVTAPSTPSMRPMMPA